MNRYFYFKPAFIALVFFCSALATFSYAQGDTEREERLEQQAIDTLFIGSDNYIDYQNGQFLSLTSDNEAEGNTAILLIHGRGYDANTTTVIKPLREALEDTGWFHLSLQMPVLEKGSKYYDYLDTFDDAGLRIAAAIDYLESQNVTKILLVAHSCSVHMSMNWLDQMVSKGQDIGIDGFVGIGMGATDLGQPMKQPLPLAKINFPVFDVYGSDDYPAVHRLAESRLESIKSNPLSKQGVIDGSNHDHKGNEDALNQAIIGWIESIL